MLNVSQLCKSFDGQPAVINVDFSVAAGERVALLGPNGAGKTTTLMMVLGVTDPDSGHVRINGHSVTDDRVQALRNVGFAAAYMTTPFTLKVKESLRVSASASGLRLDDPLIDEVVERFEIAKFMPRLGSELSSGQKTLVGLARAALARPRLLVLDEPTAYLDPSMSLQVRHKIDALCEDLGASLLITSHNMKDIDHLCSRVIFMRRGRVVHDETPDGLRKVMGNDDLDAVFVEIAKQDEREEE